MPADSNTPSKQPQPVRSIPWSFVLLIGSFIVPVLIAYIFLQSGAWSERGTASHGTLINPPADFDSLALTTTEGEAFERSAQTKKWWIMFLLPENCNETCRNAMYQMRQTYIATGAERHRVGTLVIASNHLTEDATALFDTDYPQTVVLQGNLEQINQLLSSAQPGDQPASEEQHIYLVDPMGAIFMVYPAPQDEQQAINQGKLMLKDLKRVLKLSRIG